MTKTRTYYEGAELIAHLEEQLQKAKAGELGCTAARVFRADGTWEDYVFGGTEEEREAALAEMRSQDDLH